MKKTSKRTEEKIREAGEIILTAGILKQEAEMTIRRYFGYPLITGSFLAYFFSNIKLSKSQIKNSITEIRRLRGWLPD